MKTFPLPRTAFRSLIALVISASFVGNVFGQAEVSSVGVPYTQDFSVMGTATNATTPIGFKIGTDWSTGTSATTVAYGTTGTGVVTGSSTGGTVNWANGVTGTSTDRALGFLSTGSFTSPRSIIFAFQNKTGSVVSSITVSFNYEKFRSGTRAFDWTFFHGATSTALVAATDGNQSYAADASNTVVSNPPLSTSKSVTVTGLTIPVDGVYYLRWTYTGVGGSSNAQGLGIDDFSLTLSAAAAGSPEITSAATASGVAFETSTNLYQVTASNDPTSFGASGLPDGLSIDTATGIVSGTASTPGVYPVVVSASNAQGTGSTTVTFTIAKNPGAPTITSPLTASGPVNVAFSYQIVADNSPTGYAASNLPTGLTIDTSTGLISGTPTAAGTRNVTISASNALGVDSQALVLTITSPPAITSSLAGSAVYLGSAFTYQITASGSPAPTSFGATGLPDGLTIDTGTGLISGTPTSAGVSSIEVSATNTSGTGTGFFTLMVLDQAMQNAIPLNVVVNKYANGSATTAAAVDKIQLLVVGTGVSGSTVDMRGMIIKDFSGSMANDGGAKFVFTSETLWAAVPAGTVIALSAGTTQTEDLDPADYALAVNLGNTTYFTSVGGTFDIAGTEMVMIKAAGTGANGVAGGIHALAGGTAGAQFTAFTGAKLIASLGSSAGFGVIANNTTSTLTDYGTSGSPTATDATGNVANDALDFASWNNATNQTYIESLRGSVPPNPYDSWASDFGLDPAVTTGPNAGAPTADPDGDNFNNAQEYAFGTNPTQGNGSLLDTETVGGDLTVIWLQRGDVTYTPQSTANLATTPFADDFSVTVVNGPVEPAPPAGYIRRQFTVPASGQKFYRVTGTTAAP